MLRASVPRFNGTRWLRLNPLLESHGHRMVANFLRKELDDMDGP